MTEKHHPVERLRFIADGVERANLPNFANGLREIAKQVAGWEWELRVLKQKISNKNQRRYPA